MTLGEFLSHIKHKSFKIDVYDICHKFFEGTVGEYSTSVIKSKINDSQIANMSFLINNDNTLFIEIEYEGE